MPLLNAYTTVADLREQIGDTVTPYKASQAQMERAINAASRAVDAYCHRRFWLDATPATRLYVPLAGEETVVDDIGTRSGLVIKSDTSWDGSWAWTWPDADYQLAPLNAGVDATSAYAWWRIVALRSARFLLPGRRQAQRPTLQVTARFGWSQVPVAVETATILKAASLFNRKDSPYGVAGFGEFGAVRITRSDPDVVELLSPVVKLTGVVA